MSTIDERLDSDDVYAEVFLIWECESRYVLDTLSHWIEESREPCLLVHIFLRKDTPEKDRPRQQYWLRIHETLTSTHTASRTALVSYLLQNYSFGEGIVAEGLPKENPFTRPKVRFQRMLYLVQEYEDQYEELVSLLRGSDRFQKNFRIEVVSRQVPAMNDLLQRIGTIRDSIEKSKRELHSRQCASCLLDLGKQEPRGDSRRGSYYSCGHEMQNFNALTSTRDLDKGLLTPRDNRNSPFPQTCISSMSTREQQGESCQNGSSKRNSLLLGSIFPNSPICSSCKSEGEAIRARRSTSPRILCKNCNDNGNLSNGLYCNQCMSLLMRQGVQNNKIMSSDITVREDKLAPINGPCSECSKVENSHKEECSSPNTVSPRSDPGTVSEESSPGDSPNLSRDEDSGSGSPRIVSRMTSVYPKGNQKFYCKFCPQKEFASQAIFEVHLRNCHKRCNCGCNQIFENRNEYINHFYQVFPLGCYVVRKCPERFRSLYYQALHHKEAHFADKPFYCIPCYRENTADFSSRQKTAFKDMKSLRVHGEIVGHTDHEMFLITPKAEDREQNQPKLTLRSTAINFSG